VYVPMDGCECCTNVLVFVGSRGSSLAFAHANAMHKLEIID